jgi:hypothetical protein
MQRTFRCAMERRTSASIGGENNQTSEGQQAMIPDGRNVK